MLYTQKYTPQHCFFCNFVPHTSAFHEFYFYVFLKAFFAIAGIGYWVFNILFAKLMDSELVQVMADAIKVSTQVVRDYGNAISSKSIQHY